MAIYDFKCKTCVNKAELDDFGDPMPLVHVIICSIHEFNANMTPICHVCGEPMGRIYSANFDSGSMSKGIFPATFHDWGNTPVTCDDRADYKRKMKAHDRSPVDPTDNARYRAKHARKGRSFSVNPSKA